MRPIPVLLLLAPMPVAQELVDDPPVEPPLWEEFQRLRARLDALERREEDRDDRTPATIDLSGDDLPALHAQHVLARPWYENVRLSAYGAFTYLDSGGAGTTRDGSFLVKEASLVLDAQVWERTFLFTELWLARYQFGSGISLGEFYLQRNDLLDEASALSLGGKVGKFEIPFGEEYLRWDATETPMITFTAADPYGLDEGVQLYGAARGVHWITAVTNGASGSGADDGVAKLLSGKLYGELHPDVYLSGSLLGSDGTESSALRLAGSTLTPVGAGGASSAGSSPNDDIDLFLWELDARLGATRRAGLGLHFGRGEIDDAESTFDRELVWFLVEPTIRLRYDLELVLRWSEIGTYDDEEGYRFAGKILGDGETLGYDVSRFRRASAGLRWTVNPHVAVKLEAGEDRFELIDSSPLDAENDERLYFAFEIVASY